MIPQNETICECITVLQRSYGKKSVKLLCIVYILLFYVQFMVTLHNKLLLYTLIKIHHSICTQYARMSMCMSHKRKKLKEFYVCARTGFCVCHISIANVFRLKEQQKKTENEKKRTTAKQKYDESQWIQ